MMNDRFETEVVRFQIADGRLKIQAWPIDAAAATNASSNWGTVYPICHVMYHSGRTERLCGRIEGVAVESYRRSPGGITNRLRQALRNANRYVYLRNRALGDQRSLLAAMSCLAIRGTDAYACGVGPHGSFIVSRGRLRSFVTAVQSEDLEACEDWQDDRHALGRHGVLPDPRFSYRQLLPGDLALMMAGDDAGVFQRVADEVTAIAHDEEIKRVAEDLATLLGKSTNLSALVVRLGMDIAGSQREARSRGLRGGSRVASLEQVWLASRREAKAGKVGEPSERSKAWSLPPSKELQPAQDEVVEREWAGSELIAGFVRRRDETGQVKARRSLHLLAQTNEAFRLVGALVLSLVCGLWRGSLGLLRSTRQLTTDGWTWIRQHRVFERLGRGCELALLGFWAGSKGLLIRILPERKSSIETYSASARPMARARVVGFHVSRRSRAAVGALIVLGVFMAVAVSALRIQSRLEQADVETLLAQAQETIVLAQGEGSGEGAIALLLEARELIGQATAIRADSVELRELSELLDRQWDASTGVVRIRFASDEMVTIPDGGVQRIVVHGDQLYVVNSTGQRLYRYALDEQGRLIRNQEPWIWESQREGGTGTWGRIVDLEWMDDASGRLTPALLMLTMDGSLLELNTSGAAREVSVSDALQWEDPKAIQSYDGNLYVLDLGHENILKYPPTGNDYENPPVRYFRESLDIVWSDAVDAAIDGSVYLLGSKGSIIKFAGGKPEAFAQDWLYPPLEHPVAIFASPDSVPVLVAEPDQARIVEFDPEGRFIRQFRSAGDGQDPLKELQAFAVDPHHDRLFVGTAAGLVSAPLPSQQ